MGKFVYLDLEKNRKIVFDNEEDAEDYWDAVEDSESEVCPNCLLSKDGCDCPCPT